MLDREELEQRFKESRRQMTDQQNNLMMDY